MRTISRPTAALALAGLALATLAACGDDKKSGSDTGDDKPKAFENAVSVSGVDYGYVLDKQSVKAGRTRIEFKNDGKDIHMLALAKIKAGKTFDDVKKALESEDEKDDETVVEDSDGPPNAPQILTAGEKTVTYPVLDEGTYALVCFFFAAEQQKPHFAAGMLNQLTVTADKADDEEPETDGEVTLADGKITLPDLSKGKGTFKVTASGKEDHDFTLVRIADGKTIDDMIAFVDKFFSDQAKLADMPGAIVGGSSAIKTGQSGFVELDLSPGKYYAICTESESGEDGKEHFRLNNEKVEFTVA